MKKYTTPCVMVEEFEANEAVAVCYGVRCEIGSGNSAYSTNILGSKYSNGKTYEEFEGNFTKDVLPHSNTCGSNTVIRDDMTRIYESNRLIGGKGSILASCDKNSNGILDSGDTIYWTTNLGANYHHFGTLTSQDPSHPNRS